tara:strand:+ start:1064 stop:2074 length:1011 start_codon:yes stop_codon:yes gene_type:complete
MKTILVTGSAGFIGFHLCKALINSGYDVVGLDNLNNYYNIKLKKDRLSVLKRYAKENGKVKLYNFYKIDLSNKLQLENLFKKHKFDVVINLAAQAGVRHSITNPESYIDSNILGFFNLIECVKKFKINHFLFASSSSVYGMQTKEPFSINDNTDFPVSLYAATKKSNEIIAFSYSHLYQIPSTCMRFFTVYGPYGRPDMAYFSFLEDIKNRRVISLFNNGKMKRDFTFIDDVIYAIEKLIYKIPKNKIHGETKTLAPFETYNIGNNNPVTMNRFIKALESASKKKALIKKVPMQAGDVPKTFADIDSLSETINYQPKTSIEVGIKKFVKWHDAYFS